MYAIGFRVGGYGFHSADASQTSDWDKCRMNGIGVFADRALPGPLFLEAGLDTYFSAGQAPSSDLPIDRQSVLVSVAAGARMHVTSWLARLRAARHRHGARARLACRTAARRSRRQGDARRVPRHRRRHPPRAGTRYVGANMRTLVMGNFDYDPARLQMSNEPWVARAPKSSDVFAASPALAAQGQFYLRRDL